MASTYLTSNIGSPNQQRFTWSLWVKRSKLGVEQHMVGNYNTNNRTHLFFTNTEKLYLYSELSGSNVIAYQTNRLFRDLNAWYHIVCAVDTTQAGGNRIRFYVNGEEETSFATETECNQNTNLSIGTTHYVGCYGGLPTNSNYIFDGVMSHVHFVDGSQLTPSSFGETDSTTGEWKIKTEPSVTYGSSGYFILKDGNSLTDHSGNNKSFTVGGGTLTKTEDNPSNVFATLNPLAGTAIGSYTNGNNRVVGVSSSWTTAPSTLAVSSGKFYCEAKAQHTSLMVGILDIDQMVTNNFQGTQSNGWGYEVTGTLWNNGSGTTSWGSTYTTGDIIGIAMDLDNNKLYFSKNGTWQNSADPSAGTGGISITADKTYYFAMSPVDSTSSVIETNFGNGYFGTTAVSSAGTNASGIGIFEYDVPTGYTALSTKGLNE